MTCASVLFPEIRSAAGGSRRDGEQMLDGGVDSLGPACLPEWVGVVGHFPILDEVLEVGARVGS